MNPNMMDFSRNSHMFNDQDELNVNPNDQDLLRRLTASRVAGLQSVGQDTGGFGISAGGAGSMFGQGVGVAPNQFSGSGTVAAGNAGVDPRFSMMHQVQQDREEELLLQLLLARRRRQELQQDFHTDDRNQSGGGGGGGFADELMRLRQAGNAAAASSAATAAMFAADQDQQMQMQQLQQQQQSVGIPSMMNQASGLNLNSNAPFMMQDQGGPTGLRQPAISNSFTGGRGLNDYLLRTQQNQHQDSIFSLTAEQQRIEPSTSRLLSLQQGNTMMDFNNKRVFGTDMKLAGDLEKMDSLEPPSKKKRFHKKKPLDMPRRPLSAYNLFFSEERERILKEIDQTDRNEEDDEAESKKRNDEKDGETSKPRALLRPLLPSQKKRRPHRKTHGKISFRMLAQMVGQRWKTLPVERRHYYQELAKEDMIRQKKAMEEYYLKQSEKVKKMEDTTNVGFAEDSGSQAELGFPKSSVGLGTHNR